MSLVQKDTQVILCKNIPFDNSYTDVILFPTETTRIAYFNSKSVGSYSVLSYQKTNSNVFRLEVPYANTFDTSYCFFKNPDFGNRWFYAFITQVEYINNAVTEFTYEIDVMQTYFRDSNLEQCFVEREHTNNDTVGANIIDENIPIGDYIRDEDYNSIPITGKYVYAQINTSLIGELIGLERGTDIGASYDGNTYIPLPLGEDGSIKNAVNNYLSSLQIPNIYGDVISIVITPIPFSNSSHTLIGSFELDKRISGSLNGYTPKNNKLYTYPYNYCEFCSSTGVKYPIRYEFIDGDTMHFNYYGSLSNTCGINFNINNYGVGNPIIPVNYGVTCNFNKDFSVMKIAQTLSNVGLNMINPATNQTEVTTKSKTTYREYEAGNVNKIASKSSIEDVATTISGGTKESINPKVIASGITSLATYGVTGQGFDTNTNGALYGQANISWMSYLCQPRQILQRIDDFFTRYGYATMRLKKPSLTSRRYFNYVKTQGCDTRVLAPAPDKALISSIFDNGVTFWHLPDNTDDSIVGNYSLDNTII